LVLDPHDPMTLTLSSGALVLLHRLDDAEDAARTRFGARSVACLRPGFAAGGCRPMSATATAHLGNCGLALYLMPFEPLRHITFIGIGCAHFLAERYEQAARWVQDGVEASPGSYLGRQGCSCGDGARGCAKRRPQAGTKLDA
jgi:hypothetical protein